MADVVDSVIDPVADVAPAAGGLDLGYENNARFKELSEANATPAPESAKVAGEQTPEKVRATTAADPKADAGKPATEQKEGWKKDAEAENWPKGFRKQLERMERQRERERREFAEQMEELRRGAAPQQKPEAPRKLDPKQFASNEDYIEAVVQQRIASLSQEAQAEAQKNHSQQQRMKEYSDSWNARIERLYADPQSRKDFEADLEAAGPAHRFLNENIRDYILHSDVGPGILHYLATRPEAAEALNRMHPIDLSATLHRLSVHVATPTRQPQKMAQPQRKASSAQVVGAVGTRGTGTGELSDAEQIARYRKDRTF